MRIYRNKFDVIVIDLEGEKEISSIHVDTAGVLVVGEAIRPTKHALDAALPSVTVLNGNTETGSSVGGGWLPRK